MDENAVCYCCGECKNVFKCGNEENPAIAKECPRYEYRGYCMCDELCEAYNKNHTEE